MKIFHLLKKSYKYFRKLFIKGLIFLLPIAITFSLFNFCFNLIISWLEPLRRLHLPMLEVVPYYEIIVVIIFILAVGIFLQAFILKPIIQFVENIFSKIPLIRTVYFGAKQLIEAFSGQEKSSFKDVVYVEFPRPGIYSLGFLTSEVQPEIAPDTDQTYYNIYIPTTPNPTTGFFVILTRDQFKHANISRQDAVALIISGGILQPSKVTKEIEEDNL